MNKLLTCSLFVAVATAGNLFSQVTIDNFNEYSTTGELQAVWNSFGGAASAGAAVLAPGEGVDDSNAALYYLDWSAGTNANMRMAAVPSAVQDLTNATSVEVTLSIVTRDGYDAPASDTQLRLAIQGGTSSSIWQTTSAYAVDLNSASYTTISFNLNTTEMERVDGSGSLSDTLAAITSIRLRFENDQQTNVRQDVYVDSISAVMVPEPGEYAAMAGLGTVLLVAFLRWRGRRQR